MDDQNSTTQGELICPFTGQSIEKAYGPEVHLFLHCHLRAYDRHGQGKSQELDYIDKYGAPVDKEQIWTDGYHVVEKKLADHYNAVVDNKLDFPLIAGMVGGVHLYKEYHDEPEEPWNWTGWIPLQNRLLSQGTFFSNRHFLGLRGNEVQNNLWDYHPYEQNPESEDIDELKYSQLQPNDRYRGGYWFPCQSFARYLHIIALKSHKEQETGKFKRYNYIVHPLAYRHSIDTIPDNSVDGVQWSIIKIPEERHFGPDQPWGDKVHALEIFNDFTYYYSYQHLEDSGVNNGELGVDASRSIGDEDALYYYWFDTYPLEFAVFLLDSALARGIYLQTLAANDAFYEREGGGTPSDETDGQRVREANEKAQCVLNADPKGHLFAYNLKHRQETDSRLGVKKPPPKELMREKSISSEDSEPPKPSLDMSTEEDGVASHNAGMVEGLEFFKDRPYKMNTCFGYASLIDPQEHLKKVVFKRENGLTHMGINDGDILALDYLIEGRFYSTTGLWDLFQYELESSVQIPYKINGQRDPEKLCYEMTKDMELVFTFAKCQEKNAGLVWRYTIMIETLSNTFETAHGYFKLNHSSETELDLRKSYDKCLVKWLYFTAISPKNPQHRAWFSAIKGVAFGKPRYHAKIAELEHKVFSTTNLEQDSCFLRQATTPFMPFASDSGNLDFILGKVKGEDEGNIYVYFMQVYPHIQDFENPTKPKIAESSHHPPPRIPQSVHGYFTLKDDYPTRLNLSASWDKATVKDAKVYFYAVDVKKGQPTKVNLSIKLYKVIQPPSRYYQVINGLLRWIKSWRFG